MSSFFSAFDGFEMVVASKDGTTIARQKYTFNQSPFGRQRQFILKKGRTTKELFFPVREFPANAKTVNVKVEGELCGSAYDRILSTKTISSEIKNPSHYDK
jgi:hypothetical protein